MDYFSKWPEAVTFSDFTTMTIREFIWIHIIYRFGDPKTIMADNGQLLKRTALYKL